MTVTNNDDRRQVRTTGRGSFHQPDFMQSKLELLTVQEVLSVFMQQLALLRYTCLLQHEVNFNAVMRSLQFTCTNFITGSQPCQNTDPTKVPNES